jgi:hypothetical protein
VLGAAAASLGQPGGLSDDLEQLIIRRVTDHYELAGTIDDTRIQEYGRCLEYIHDAYSTGFGELLSATPGQAEGRQKKDLKPHLEGDESAIRFKVVILKNDQEYQSFVSKYFTGWSEHTRGLYVHRERLLLIRDEWVSRDTYDVLFHEAFHQFLHRYVAHPPIWIDEGLATYFGTARATPSGLVFDRPRSDLARVVASTAAARKLIPWRELMTASRDRFYSREPIEGIDFDRTTLAYAQSYTLVAFMLSDPGGRDLLRRYVRDLARATSVAKANEITRSAFPGGMLDGLVTEWLHFVNKH